MIGNKEYYYNKGIIEGYFDVRLENILEQDIEIRQSFLKGYKEGKNKRENLTEQQIQKYEMNRIGYIKQIGFEVGYNDYPANCDTLRDDDKKLFELGLSAGLARKQQNKSKSKVNKR